MNETVAYSSGLAPLISLVVVLVITLSGLALNIFLLAVLIRSPSLHTLENSFVAHLAGSDFFLGIIAIGHSIFLNFSFEDKNYEKQLCLGLHALRIYISSVQIFNFWWLTFYRFLKVCYPFTHDRFCTKRNVILSIILTHSVSIMATVMGRVNSDWNVEHYCIMFYIGTADNKIVFSLIVVCILMTIFGLNLKILMVARRQRREIMVQARSTTSEETQSTNTRNIGKVLGILTLFTFVTYIPSWSYTTLLIAGVEISKPVSDSLAFASTILWNCNPLVDSFTFLLCRRDIKTCAFRLLGYGRQ